MVHYFVIDGALGSPNASRRAASTCTIEELIPIYSLLERLSKLNVIEQETPTWRLTRVLFHSVVVDGTGSLHVLGLFIHRSECHYRTA